MVAKPTAQALRAKGHVCLRNWCGRHVANANAVGDEYESFGGEYSGGGETVGRCEEMWGVIFGRAHCQSIQWMFSDLVMELVQRQGGNPKASAFARAFEVEAGEKAIESQEVGIS